MPINCRQRAEKQEREKKKPSCEILRTDGEHDGGEKEGESERDDVFVRKKAEMLKGKPRAATPLRRTSRTSL